MVKDTRRSSTCDAIKSLPLTSTRRRKSLKKTVRKDVEVVESTTLVRKRRRKILNVQTPTESKSEQSQTENINSHTDRKIKMPRRVQQLQTVPRELAKYFSDSKMPANFTYAHTNVYRVGKDKRKQVPKEFYTICDCKNNCPNTCINRRLRMECDSDCLSGDKCQNKRITNHQNAAIQCFATSNDRGFGVKTLQNLNPGDFVIEYCGEVISSDMFEKRSKKREKECLFYGMRLSVDFVVDATRTGNLARFINHSCDPNCTTAIWTVGQELRIGIFAIKYIKEGTELTYDYQFETFGRTKQQECLCGADNCSGFIGKQYR
ncbi:histone-lysine N-methyltransferase [Acrasis kona]|uniref:Histone-lysine N-methyltransferase n=1 Tax=Acrasis kona TaxID=1008807 RepID=A0AAW2YVX1_9EUKA